MHGSIKFDFFISLSLEFIFCSEDFHDLFRKILFSIFGKIVLVDMFAYFEIKFDILNVFKFFFVLSHSATDQTVFM